MEYTLKTIIILLISFSLCSCSLQTNDYSAELYKDTSDMFYCTLLLADSIKNSSERNDLLKDICIKYVENGLFDKALQVSDKIDKEATRQLLDISKKFVDLGDSSKANSIIDRILNSINKSSNTGYKNNVLKDICCMYCNIGQVDMAFSTCELINDPEVKANTLLEISKACINSSYKNKVDQLLNKSLSIADSMENTIQKVKLFENIAQEYMELGMDEQAIKLFSKAVNIIDMNLAKNSVRETENLWYNIYSLATISSKLYYLNDKMYSEEIFKKLVKTINSIDSKNTTLDRNVGLVGPVETMSGIVGIFVQEGQYERAIYIANMADKDLYKVKAFTDIALKCAEVGEKNIADMLLDKSLKITDCMDSLYWKYWSLKRIADIYIKSEEIYKAVTVLSHVFDNSLNIKDNNINSYNVFIDLADLFCKCGQFNNAQKIINMIDKQTYSCYQTNIVKLFTGYNQLDIAFEYSDSIQNVRDKILSRVYIANALIINGTEEKGIEILEQALYLLDLIENSEEKVNILLTISDVLINIGYKDKAEEVLLNTLEQIEFVKSINDKVYMLTEINIKYTKLNKKISVNLYITKEILT